MTEEEIYKLLQDYLTLRHSAVIELKDHYVDDKEMNAYYRGEQSIIQEFMQHIDDVSKEVNTIEADEEKGECGVIIECQDCATDTGWTEDAEVVINFIHKHEEHNWAYDPNDPNKRDSTKRVPKKEEVK